jgi:hypothetical protein
MANPNSSTDARIRAMRTLESMIQRTPAIRQSVIMGLRDNGMTLNAENRIITTTGGAAVPGPWSQANSAMASGMQAQMTPPRPTAGDALSNANKAGSGQGIGLRSTQDSLDSRYPDQRAIGGTDSIFYEPGQLAPGGETQSLDAGFTMGRPADPNDYGVDPKYKDTFFGGLPGVSIDEAAADPDTAWSLFRTRGGPGRGSLQNSTVGQYGENNFRSAMDLAGILGETGMGPQDTLGYTDASMRRQMTPGGGYMDPAKILNAAFAQIGAQPDVAEQERLIQTALQAVEPYMDPTQYRMMQSRVNRAIENYVTYGLENGTEDLNGVLLQSLQRAIGM